MSTEKLPKDCVLYSYCIYDLHEIEKRKLPHLQSLLEMKLEANDNTIDMPKLCAYLNTTEMIARTMINYVETNFYYTKKFLIINGSKEWETVDQIRASKV